MADKQLHVYMDGTLSGSVTMSASGTLGFEYDGTYRSSPGQTPLSLSMPLVLARHRQRAVLPYLRGLLPDSEQALRSMAATYQVSARSPFALLQHVGHDVAGALQFVEPAGTSEDAVADRRAMTPISDEEVASELRTAIEIYRTGRPAPSSIPFRMSLAGAQPKIALARTAAGGWAHPTRGAPTTHILKPEYRRQESSAGERFPDMTVVEMFGLATAKHAGLRASEANYWMSPDGEVRALVVARYDRRLEHDGTVRRLHQEDLCQALSVPPEKKYQHLYGGPGVGAVGELIRFRLRRQDGESVARDFLAALTLNVALVNTDAHAKNYSLMLIGDQVQLAPAYDILSIAQYADHDDREHPLALPMRIGDTYEFRAIHRATLAAEGTRLGLSLEESREIVDTVLDAVPGALELARDDLAEVPEGRRVADTVIANLRAISPLHTGGPRRL